MCEYTKRRFILARHLAKECLKRKPYLKMDHILQIIEDNLNLIAETCLHKKTSSVAAALEVIKSKSSGSRS